MKKKILIGSIISIAILIGVSFTSVVGYNSVASDVKASPLFNIRSSRAIDEENQDLSCEYVGKGEESLISFSKFNKNQSLEKIINLIININDEEFSRLIYFINKYQPEAGPFSDLKIKELLLLIRYKIDSLKYIIDPDAMENPLCLTMYICTYYGGGILECIIEGIGTFIFLLLSGILLTVLAFFATIVDPDQCHPLSCGPFTGQDKGRVRGQI